MPVVQVTENNGRSASSNAHQNFANHRGVYKGTTGTDRLRLLGGNAKYFVVGAIVFLLLVVAYEIRKHSNDDKTKNSSQQQQHTLLVRQFLEECSSSFGTDFRFRPELLPFKPGVYCEGYWRDEADKNNLKASSDTGRTLPFPEQLATPFCGQSKLLQMMEEIEKSASSDDNASAKKNSGFRILRERQRGLSSSRLEAGMFLGNTEFAAVPEVAKQQDDAASKDALCWTGDLRSYYIAKFNVVPSAEFVHRLLNVYSAMKA